MSNAAALEPAISAPRRIEIVDVSYRPATPADADVVAPLLREALGRYCFLLGTDDPAVIDGDLRRLFVHPNNRFSHRYALVAEADGEVGGVMISYPHEVLTALFWPTLGLLLRVLGLWRFLTGPVLNVDQALGKESEEGEYHGYICGVNRPFRRAGIATMFVLEAERIARERGYPMVSCTADLKQKALEGGLALGYEIVETIHKRKGCSYHRIRKTLAQGAGA